MELVATLFEFVLQLLRDLFIVGNLVGLLDDNHLRLVLRLVLVNVVLEEGVEQVIAVVIRATGTMICPALLRW